MKNFLKKQADDFGAVNLVPMVLAVIIAFCILFVGAYVNGTISGELHQSLGLNPPETSAESRVKARMNNTSWNWDSALDIVQVVIIISILAAAIGAIFMFTRFGG